MEGNFGKTEYEHETAHTISRTTPNSNLGVPAHLQSYPASPMRVHLGMERSAAELCAQGGRK